MQSEGDEFAVLNSQILPPKHSAKPWELSFYSRVGTDCLPIIPIICPPAPKYADRVGKANALIECGTHGTEHADQIAFQALMRTLSHLNLISSISKASHSTQKIQLNKLSFRESTGDTFLKTFANFEKVSRGQILGVRGKDQSEVVCPLDGVIVFPSPVSDVGTEWFYLGEYI